MPRALHVMEYGLMGCFDDPASLFCSILMPPCMFGVTMSHVQNFPCGMNDVETLETPIEIAALRDEGDKKRCLTGCMLYTVGCCFAQAWARKKIEEDLAVRWDGVKPEKIAEQVKEMGDAEDESSACACAGISAPRRPAALSRSHVPIHPPTRARPHLGTRRRAFDVPRVGETLLHRTLLRAVRPQPGGARRDPCPRRAGSRGCRRRKVELSRRSRQPPRQAASRSLPRRAGGSGAERASPYSCAEPAFLRY